MDLGKPREGLGGLKLDEIDAANSFPMLPMARNSFKWPVMSPLFPYFSYIFPISFHISYSFVPFGPVFLRGGAAKHVEVQVVLYYELHLPLY